jgi:transcriptional regulator with XRE-family HTH domain
VSTSRQGLQIPNFYARRLSRELTQLRVQAGLTQRDLFETTQLSNKTVWRFEAGQQVPRYLELNALLDAYGVPACDWHPYHELWHSTKQKGWWHGQALRDALYIANEHEASIIRDVQMTYVPDLLQTEGYARQLLDTDEPPLSRTRLQVELAGRMRRQQLLEGDAPIELHALIYQPVLHARIERAQLRLLMDRAAQPNVTIQIVPRTGAIHGGLHGSFTMLAFPHEHEPDICYTKGPLGLGQGEQAEQVARLGRLYKSLVTRAMSPEVTCAYLEKLSSQRNLARSGAY